jgi:hypothetical protein
MAKAFADTLARPQQKKVAAPTSGHGVLRFEAR